MKVFSLKEKTAQHFHGMTLCTITFAQRDPTVIIQETQRSILVDRNFSSCMWYTCDSYMGYDQSGYQISGLKWFS